MASYGELMESVCAYLEMKSLYDESAEGDAFMEMNGDMRALKYSDPDRYKRYVSNVNKGRVSHSKERGHRQAMQDIEEKIKSIEAKIDAKNEESRKLARLKYKRDVSDADKSAGLSRISEISKEIAQLKKDRDQYRKDRDKHQREAGKASADADTAKLWGEIDSAYALSNTYDSWKARAEEKRAKRQK